MDPSSFAGRVRSCLEHADGLSMRELDSLAGLHPGHVWQITKGRRENPTRDTARRLATVFGCTVGWLLEGEGPPPTREAVRSSVERLRRAQDPNAIAPSSEVVIDPDHAQTPAQDEVPAFDVDTPRAPSRRSSRRSAALGG